jgi:hypothetical protein
VDGEDASGIGLLVCSTFNGSDIGRRSNDRGTGFKLLYAMNQK